MADIECVLAALLGFVASLTAVSIWGTCNLMAIWVQNLKNHGMFYDHNSRTYLAWLAVNPLEAALALGAPLTCCVVMGLVCLWRRRGQIAADPAAAIAFSQGAAWFVVWSILWLSGKNMGEAARLWIFLAPWPVMTAVAGLYALRSVPVESATGGAALRGISDKYAWRFLLFLQIITSVWTMWWIDGFHFAELLPK